MLKVMTAAAALTTLAPITASAAVIVEVSGSLTLDPGGVYQPTGPRLTDYRAVITFESGTTNNITAWFPVKSFALYVNGASATDSFSYGGAYYWKQDWRSQTWYSIGVSDDNVSGYRFGMYKTYDGTAVDLSLSGAQSFYDAFAADGIFVEQRGQRYFESYLYRGNPDYKIKVSGVGIVPSFVPEPATWVFLMLGFALLGAAVRKNGTADWGRGLPISPTLC